MKRRTVLVTLALGLLVGAPALAQEPDRRPGVAVLPFEDGGWTGISAEDRQALGVGVQQLLLNELAQNTGLRIVERNVLRRLMEEQDLGATGRVDAETAARIGRLVGARYVILGTISDFGGANPTVLGRIVSVETSEILRAEQTTGRKEELYRMVVDLADRVTRGVDLPALSAEVRNERRSRPVPPDAVTLYSRAQVMADLGRTERAIELYEQIQQQFPAMQEEAAAALRQLRSG
jgi:TolB-like protein